MKENSTRSQKHNEKSTKIQFHDVVIIKGEKKNREK